MRRLLAAVSVAGALAVGAASPAAVAPACGDGYYRNVSGACVHRPSASPAGATARCRDGSYSYSRNARGTCSGHGGVSRWIRRSR